MNWRDKPVIRLRGATDEAVVAVTASAPTHETERYRAAGMDGCRDRFKGEDFLDEPEPS